MRHRPPAPPGPLAARPVTSRGALPCASRCS